jgi:hypothetical protein
MTGGMDWPSGIDFGSLVLDIHCHIWLIGIKGMEIDR